MLTEKDKTQKSTYCVIPFIPILIGVRSTFVSGVRIRKGCNDQKWGFQRC